MSLHSIHNRILLLGGIGIFVSFCRKVIQHYSEKNYGEYLKSLQEIKKQRSLLHRKYRKGEIEEVDVIIIGSGMSGLSCGAILSRLGYKVLILEQHHDVCGGGTHMFELKGYSFDSGLHYTVPWSVPVFALTCGLKPSDVCPFDLMGDEESTVDKIYIVPPKRYVVHQTDTRSMSTPFCMKLFEAHIPELYRSFPHEKKAIDKFLSLAADAMTFVKLFLFSKLLPKWMQKVFWWWVPRRYINSVATTAKELLPSITADKRLISLLSSMWIDTGARPDRASFMMTASVFRGVSMEGGCYPRGGSSRMAEELVSVIEYFGGQVSIRATVKEIVYDEARRRVSGVRMMDGSVIRSRRGVVSSCGLLNTYKFLLQSIPSKLLPPTLESLGVSQSAGFVMCNIGIRASAGEIGATNTNTWHIPVDEDGDAFPPLEKYFKSPLDPDNDIPAFITFPSLKVAFIFWF